MYENIFLTGLVFAFIMAIVPKIVGNDVPTSLKMAIVVPGMIGVVAMIISAILSIWAN